MKGLLLKGAIRATGIKRTYPGLKKAQSKKALVEQQLLEPPDGKCSVELASTGLDGTDIEAYESIHSASEVSEGDGTPENNIGQGEGEGEGSDGRKEGSQKKRRLENRDNKVQRCQELGKDPIIPPAWQALLGSILENSPSKLSVDAACHVEHHRSIPIVAVCGGKNVGKSTLARYLVNSLLKSFTKVGYLETDVGQPELTPPGCLSLHILDKTISGRTTLEMRNPDRLYFFGDVSPKGNPELYLRSITSLYDYFCEDYYNPKVKTQDKQFLTPLVINTHGWIRGVGYDALVDILRYTVPTHVVQVLSQAQSKNLPHKRFWDLDSNSVCRTKLLYVHSAVEATSMLSLGQPNARQLRDLRVISYFRDCIRDKLRDGCLNPDICTEAAKALICHKPYQVPISMIQIMHLHFQVPPSQSLSSVNAMLVGLGMSSTSKKCEEGILKRLPPICVGLGIVRGVDIQRGYFHVITPVSLERLQMVDTFLQGCVELPISLLQVPGYLSPYLCQNSISIEGTGSASMGSGKKKLLRGRPTAVS